VCQESYSRKLFKKERGFLTMNMLFSTTSTLDGLRVVRYLGVIDGRAILGANIFRDFLAGITDIIGGRSSAYEQKLDQARDIAMREMAEKAEQMGANGIIGIDLDYETITLGNGGGMLMVSASGTAVLVEQEGEKVY
jgi:uncharacterized protein YbjQ (UPF0145 family)